MDGRDGLLLVVRDVSWERNAQARIRMLSDAVDAMPKGVVILTSDGGVRYANEAFASRYGCSPDDMTGCPVESLGWYLTSANRKTATMVPFAPAPRCPKHRTRPAAPRPLACAPARTVAFPV